MQYLGGFKIDLLMSRKGLKRTPICDQIILNIFKVVMWRSERVNDVAVAVQPKSTRYSE